MAPSASVKAPVHQAPASSGANTSHKGKNSSWGIILIVGAGTLIIAVMFVIVICCCSSRKKLEPSLKDPGMMSIPGFLPCTLTAVAFVASCYVSTLKFNFEQIIENKCVSLCELLFIALYVEFDTMHKS